MEQAPPIIAQTVNRVVERTVERVVPAAQEASAAAAPVITEKTIIVKETDYIAAAVEKVTPSIVRLYTTTKDAAGEPADIFLGLGIVTAASGTIMSDSAVWPASDTVFIGRADGTRVPAQMSSKDETTGILILAASSTDLSWHAASSMEALPVLGAPVISLAGRSTMRIGNGIVSALPSDSSVHFLDTTVPQGAILYGSVLVDDQGRVIGISTVVSRAQAETVFLATRSTPLYTQTQPDSTQIAE
jgi:S1-C subfamily serine protease